MCVLYDSIYIKSFTILVKRILHDHITLKSIINPAIFNNIVESLSPFMEIK